MARVKAVARKYKSRSMVPGRAVLTPAALNSRIHRILNAGQELKRYSVDTGIAFGVSQLSSIQYVNPFAGIVQGTAINNRLGDTITVEKIVVTIRWYPGTGGSQYYDDFDISYRNTMLKVPDTSLVSTTLAAITLSNYTYSGFISTGMLNDHDNKIISDKKRKYTASSRSAGFPAVTGSGYHFDVMEQQKTFTGGHKIVYKTGSNIQNQDNFIMILAADMSSYPTVTPVSPGSFYYAYNVFFRDA